VPLATVRVSLLDVARLRLVFLAWPADVNHRGRGGGGSGDCDLVLICHVFLQKSGGKIEQSVLGRCALREQGRLHDRSE